MQPGERPRWVDRLLARWRCRSLDAELAEGAPVDIDPRRAVRAAMLIEPGRRQSLADAWVAVLRRARQSTRVGDPRVPVVRTRVLSAGAEITELIDALRAPAPVPARGVAIASRLLTDGTGPVYSQRSQQDLSAAVRAAVQYLDPLIEFDPAQLDH